MAAKDLISADQLLSAAWAAVRAADVARAGSEDEQTQAETAEANVIAAALGEVMIGWRQGRGYPCKVIVFVADMPHAIKKVRA